MNLHVGSKLIKSLPMNRADYNIYRGWELPEGENGSDEGCLVEYLDGGQANHKDHDGYISWSPKEVFKNAYQDVTQGVSFGSAIMLLKLGHKVARKGWNGANMFVVYQKGYPDGIPCNKQTAEAWGLKEGDLFVVRPYLQLRCADGSHAMWAPSGSDSLANDWVLVE